MRAERFLLQRRKSARLGQGVGAPVQARMGQGVDTDPRGLDLLADECVGRVLRPPLRGGEHDPTREWAFAGCGKKRVDVRLLDGV